MDRSIIDISYFRHSLETLEALPTLPAIALKGIKQALTPSASVPELAKIIELDPPLTIKILQAANKPYLGQTKNITSLQEALSSLDHSVIRSIILSVSVFDLFSDKKKDYGIKIDGLWIHSISTAVWARQLAPLQRPAVDPEKAFIAGLLHDIGRITLCHHLRTQYKEIIAFAQEKKVPLYQAERDCMGFDHTDIGQWLFEHWNIPLLYRAATLYHHSPNKKFHEETDHFYLSRLINLADHLCSHYQTGQGEKYIQQKSSLKLPMDSAISFDDLDKIKISVDEGVEELLERLDLRPISTETYFPVLIEANLALRDLQQEQENRQINLIQRERELAGINILGLQLQGSHSLQNALRHLTETLVASFPFKEAISTLYLDGDWELLAQARKDGISGRCQTLLAEQSRQPEPYQISESGGSWLFVDLIGKQGPLGYLKVQPDKEEPLFMDKMGLFLASCAKLASEAIERIQSHQKIQRLTENLKRSVVQLDEEKAKAEQEKIQKDSIFDGLPLGLLLLDEQGNIQCYNPAAKRMFPKIVTGLGKSFIEIFPDPMFQKGKELVLEGEQLFRKETTITDMTTGSEKIYQWRLSPIEGQANGEKSLLCILDDRTEDHAMQKQLLEAARMASVGELAAGTAHNLRSPLGAVKGILELLLEEIEEGRILSQTVDMPADPAAQPPEPVKDQLQIVLKSLDKCFSIIDDLLQFARRPDRPPETLCLNELLNGTESLLDELFKEREIKIERDLQTTQVFGRQTDLTQVFLNLYSNAYKAMPQGGKFTIRSRLVSQSANIPLIKIFLSDTGYGIPQEHLPKIFDPFFTTSERVEGTGLGLSLTRKIIKEHGGTIEVNSTVGKGTSFCITLPVQPSITSEKTNEAA